jgi:hypothetical protein
MQGTLETLLKHGILERRPKTEGEAAALSERDMCSSSPLAKQKYEPDCCNQMLCSSSAQEKRWPIQPVTSHNKL